ncbi:helix-turn-helix domain-containing protein [Mucilaginibacter polytrichastri]|uniref:Helix-turn-helix domain-containing protein n=1 Tax=Mucilaginibacter polytrichastri TaxID=1302689 RepID=A0A1Q6A2F1_9SPHI|nr:helix-turn-helix domain-containing protein [Mucilaginibacter polytrichastri]OKS88178.1 hypothetical protein RG47T_3642 [Mucilaginibacter polytrichastri]SFT08823.1 Helix-turn-helix domain-containing protein [Mucilaginibacter polytrichastri]
MDLKVICLEEPAFYELLERLYKRLNQEKEIKQDKWISGEEAMQRLRIKSKTTLQKLRDEGKIRYSQPEKKIILYDGDSINDYLNDFIYEPF